MSQKYIFSLQAFAFPFFVFSLVTALALSATQYTILPQLLEVNIDGTVHHIDELHAQKQVLEEQRVQKLQERNALLIPTYTPQLQLLREEKASTISIEKLLTSIQDIAQSFTKEDIPTVYIQNWIWDATTNTLTCSGIVKNVELRSMTILAEFHTALQAAFPSARIDSPLFIRQETQEHGIHSPFTLIIHL